MDTPIDPELLAEGKTPNGFVSILTWLLEHLFFAIALFVSLPAIRSEGRGLQSTETTVWVATAAFIIAQVFACVGRRAEIGGAIIKSLLFWTYAYVLWMLIDGFGGTPR